VKSKAAFHAANDVVMSTGLAAYMKTFLVFQPGDWPCQFYSRQIIYEYLKKQTNNPLMIFCHATTISIPLQANSIIRSVVIVHGTETQTVHM